MKKLRTKLILAGAYILTFVLALILTCVIQNYGVTGGKSPLSTASLPTLYISYGEAVLNKMSAYVREIDCGYLRESVSVLDSSGQITVGVNTNGHTVSSLKYRLSNAANEYVAEEGDITPVSGTQNGNLYVFEPKNPLVDNREYCLTLILTDEEGNEYYYYTRVVSGENYKLSDKLEFVWNFNKNTMNPEMSATIKTYLETSGLNDNSSFTNIDIYSSADAVMWGDLSPSVTGTMATTVKAISADAATIKLTYKVQVYEDASTYKEYYVDEYYTIQLDNEVWHLKDFRRSLSELPGNDSFETSQNMIRLGVVSEASLGFLTEKTQSGDMAVFAMDGRLWYYDVTNNMMTCVLEMDTAKNSNGNYPYGIKALDIEPDGTLHFIVYGYMTGGAHEGENGIAVYLYSPESNSTKEQAFIPSDRGYEVLKMDVDKLAFMNDSHQLYLCLNDIVYRIDYTNGQVREVVEQLDINNYKLSADGTILAMPNSPQIQNASEILVYYLDTGETKTITAQGKALKLLGFFRNDIVYGTADPSTVYEDSVGSQIVPMDKIYIADRELNVVREYSSSGKYIMDVKLGDSTVDISLASPVLKDGKTVYEMTEGDYLVNNEAKTEDDVALVTVYDNKMRNEIFIKLPVTSLAAPLTRSAVVKESSESVFEIDAPKEMVEKYYLYTGDGLYRDYTKLTDAIEACTKPTGLVVSGNKQIVWQKSIKSAEHLMSFPAITKGEIIPSIVQAICSYAEGNTETSVDGSMSLSQALGANLKNHQVVSLRGLSLDDVLYFVYSDRPVVAQLREDEFVIIVGYNSMYLQIADPTTGEVGDWNYAVYSEIFEEEGNIFLSYY